jgi:phage tail-like protein
VRVAASALSGLTKYGNVMLKQGVTTSLELFHWHQQIVSGQLVNKRKRVVIVVQDEGGANMTRYVITNAWRSNTAG